MPQYNPDPRAIQLTEGFATLKIDAVKLLQNIYEAAFDVGDLKAGTALKRLLDSFKTSKPIEANAYELIFTSLIAACRNLVKEKHPEVWDSLPAATIMSFFKSDAGKKIKDFEISIAKDFFDNPTALPFLKDFLPFYKEWLQSFGVPEATSHALALKLRHEFGDELMREWDRKVSYPKLLEHFSDNPFAENWKSRDKIQTYYQQIKAYYHQPALGDPKINLSDIYIQPNFGVHRRNLPDTDHYRSEESYVPLSKDSIHQYINDDWQRGSKRLDLNAEQSRLLLLLGQPGQGKTSFCFRLIHDTLQDIAFDKDLVFIRLRDLENPREFIQFPFKELERHFISRGMAFDFDRCLLILDGLDELYMSEGLTNAEISDFFYKLPRHLKGKDNLQIVITSRWHYVDLSKIDKDDALILALSPLTLEQQLQWLDVYKSVHNTCQLTPDKLVEINDEKNKSLNAIRELINQPILLHLVAKADFAIEAGENRATIYERLFDTLIRRSWEKSGQLKKFKEIDAKRYRRYIAALAYKIYQSDHQYMMLSELESMEETETFEEKYLTKSKHKNTREALKDVLITFYFKEVEENRVQADSEKERDQAFEFYHKSLQEYLAAEHIWQTVLKKFTATDDDGDFILHKWEDALQFIWGLFPKRALTREVADYLVDIITNEASDKKQALNQQMVHFLPKLLRHQFLYEYKAPDNHQKPIKRAAGCFMAYWHLLIHANPNENHITETIMDDFAEMLVISARFSPLSFNLTKQNLIVILDGANLNGANLNGAILYGAILYRATLYEADLDGATLNRATLSGAILVDATLVNAHLNGAALDGATLHRAHLDGAHLDGATGLTFEQLSQVYSLRDCRGIPSELEARLRAEKPELFER